MYHIQVKNDDRMLQVMALIDAKIVAWENRRCVKESCEPAEKSVRTAKCRAHRQLPDDLPVPSSVPRPPNLNAPNLSFAARLVLAVRDLYNGDAPHVYEAAGVTRAAYSQIISDETHRVDKRTAIRFAFALRLDPDQARLLLKSAGYAFSRSLTEDFVLESCLEVNPPIYDFDDVNCILDKYHVKYRY